MIAFILSLAIPWLAAYGVLTCWLRDDPQDLACRAFRLSLSFGLGCGASSCGLYAWLELWGSVGREFVVCETLALGFVMLCLWKFSGRRSVCATTPVPPSLPAAYIPWQRLLWGALGGCLAITAAGMILSFIDEPHGGWDAWAFWNQRARYLNEAGPGWRSAFEGFNHVDYPLLVPLTVTRTWMYMGDSPVWAPWAIGCCFTMATFALLVSGVARLRSSTQALLAGLALLGTIRFARTGALQYADVPLSLFMLATVMLLMLYDRQTVPRRGLLFLAGVTASLAAWTKNEGLLFITALGVAWCLTGWYQYRGRAALRLLVPLLVGAVPVLTILVLFKSQLTETNDLVEAGQGLSTALAKVTDPARYKLIARGFFQNLLIVVKPLAIVLPGCFVLLGPVPRAGRMSSGLLTTLLLGGLMLAGYTATYLITPHDLKWHLETSFDRLIVQLWPAVLLVYFLLMQTPEEHLHAAREKESRKEWRRNVQESEFAGLVDEASSDSTRPAEANDTTEQVGAAADREG